MFVKPCRNQMKQHQNDADGKGDILNRIKEDDTITDTQTI